ncbi:MAG: NAD-dependent dehydratase [Actinobacteria bacterium]|nr:MAG: NAD-dependent dehydratase [Actinomycetota bacterium]
MRVLVTGGCGFVGTHLAATLAAEGAEVVVLDRVEPTVAVPGVDYRLGDLRDQAVWAGLLEGVDAVSHQAARVGLGVDMGDVGDYVADNDVGTAQLLLALHRADFAGRLVMASSMVVYGEGAYRCAEHGGVRPGPRTVEDLGAGRFDPPCPVCGGPLDPGTVSEDAPVDPRNVYAATKLHQEHLGAAYGREAGVAVAALRYHNVYGPGMPRDTPYAGVASIFRSELDAGRSPAVFEDGGQRRDFVHVTDVARANVLALSAEPAPTGPFNIASGEARTVGDLATALADRISGGALVPAVTARWRLGDVRHIVASPARAREMLGFEAAVGFAEGMAELAGVPAGTGATGPTGRAARTPAPAAGR